MKFFSAIVDRYKKYRGAQEHLRHQNEIELTSKKYFENGQMPWSEGYEQHKLNSIIEGINAHGILQKFAYKRSLVNFGYRLDERIVEYPWIFNNLSPNNLKLLDAGSTFNFEYILEHPFIKSKELTIFTYAPESPNFNEKRISYVYGDLREMPFKEEYFDMVVSQSTIEHIDMNNSMYGYDISHHNDVEIKSYEYLKAIKEMIRVLKPGGMLLITFPFGKFENHNFFQQLDTEMLEKLLNEFYLKGSYNTSFYRYLPDGWFSCEQSDCAEIVSFNPHTGRGKGTDGAAHCRSICCIKFLKN